MSKADKMFEDFGSIMTEENNIIEYTYILNNEHKILFIKGIKIITLEGFHSLDMQELQAINEKCKELRVVR
jgi:hypothetical protein